MRTLLVVDGDNLAHRAYHAMPKSIRGAAGQPINAVVGWVSMLLAVYEAERPDGVFVGWDTQNVPTYRHTLWPTYQGGREFDAEILEQLEVLPKVAAALGLGQAQQPGAEADDLMASAVVAHSRRNGGISLVLTTDKDAYQLVGENVWVLSPQTGGKPPLRIGPTEVEARFGVRPEQVPEFKALAGDPSDNIPGARGIGPKTAASLLKQHGSLDGVLAFWAAGPSVHDPELLRAFREVAQVRTDLDVQLPSGPPDWGGGARLLQDLGAARLSERLATMDARTRFGANEGESS